MNIAEGRNISRKKRCPNGRKIMRRHVKWEHADILQRQQKIGIAHRRVESNRAWRGLFNCRRPYL